MNTKGPNKSELRATIRGRYTSILAEATDSEHSTCCADASSCEPRAPGYSESDLDTVQGSLDLNLGCGNPTASANLQEGETVLDLGSGGGFDCFLAADEVGPTGQVIGVDMTPAMVETARENIKVNDASNVEFRLGEIEHLPIADESVDVILSNCVINLSPDKLRVFDEAHRVLQPEGRLAISDVVRITEIPDVLQSDPSSVAACIGGAVSTEALEEMLSAAGFTDVSIQLEHASDQSVLDWGEDLDLDDYVAAAIIEAKKPPSEDER